jgi:hypothetical protein
VSGKGENMIYLDDDCLEIRFPELHENAGVRISFQRTLRLPDNGETHFLPPSLGNFPLRHIEDYDLGERNNLKKRGGIIMPMFQADALWLDFSPIDRSKGRSYPIAIKIGTGKICAISGDNLVAGLNRDPQDYVVVPDQPWIDGYNVGKDIVKQFVASPLGHGYTVEEQLKSEADTGGIQIQVFPMKRKFYDLLNRPARPMGDVSYCMAPSMSMESMSSPEMGLAAGGKMRQEIYEDDHEFDAWDLRTSQRCFVTLANAEQWMDLTGEEPPLSPMSADTYTRHDLPWFDYYGGDKNAIDGAKKLGKIKSIKEIKPKKGKNFWGKVLPVNNPKVVKLEPREVNVGEW